MATITRVGKPSPATTTQDPGPNQIKGRAAAGGLLAGDLVYLVDVGGVPTLTKASGAAATAPALAVGMMPNDVGAGEKGVAYFGMEFNYGSGLTAGTRVYASATAGAIDDGVTTGGTVPVGFVTNDTNIFIFAPTR